ncbi:MAG TPA: SRPBCC family protein [Spongiibacteraceae bacterium]
MEVKLDKNYPLDVDVARAWATLRDIKAVAGCMPGAAITEEISAMSYKGAVKVKVGPVAAQFGGTLDILELDEASRKMSLRGKGADKGGSSASMDLVATIVPDAADPNKSTLHGEAAVIVNGKFAQFGGRMMVQVSDMVLDQFADNFRAAASALSAPAGVATAASPTMANSVSAAPVTPKDSDSINGLAIFWALIKRWFRGLFRQQH